MARLAKNAIQGHLLSPHQEAVGRMNVDKRQDHLPSASKRIGSKGARLAEIRLDAP